MRPMLAEIILLGITWHTHIIDAEIEMPVRPHITPPKNPFAILLDPETASILSTSATQEDQVLFAVIQGFAGTRFNVSAVTAGRAVIKARGSVAGLKELSVPGSAEKKTFSLVTVIEIAWRALRSQNITNLEHQRVFRALYIECLRNGLKTSRKDPWSNVPLAQRPTTLALQGRDGVLFTELVRAGHKVTECNYLIQVISHTVESITYLAKDLHSAAALSRYLREQNSTGTRENTTMLMRDHFEFIFLSFPRQLTKQLRAALPALGKVLDGEPIVDRDVTRRGLLRARDLAIGFLLKMLMKSKSFDPRCLLQTFPPKDGTIFHRAAREGLSLCMHRHAQRQRQHGMADSRVSYSIIGMFWKGNNHEYLHNTEQTNKNNIKQNNTNKTSKILPSFRSFVCVPRGSPCAPARSQKTIAQAQSAVATVQRSRYESGCGRRPGTARNDRCVCCACYVFCVCCVCVCVCALCFCVCSMCVCLYVCACTCASLSFTHLGCHPTLYLSRWVLYHRQSHINSFFSS